MKILKGLLFVLLVGFYGSVSAQDIHFTMFDMAPINLNPAYTGFYEGTFRIGGIYRSQWQGLGTNAQMPSSVNNPGAYPDRFSGFKTPSAFIDLPFAGIRSKNDKWGKAKHWFGAGLNFFNDQAGALSQLKAELALAFHAGLGARGNTRLSFGLKGGIIQQSLGEAGDYVFESQILGLNPDPENFTGGTATGMDISAGIMLGHRATGWGVEVGASFNHLTSPDLTILTQEYRLPNNIIMSVKSDFALGSKFSTRPMFFAQYMASVLEMNLQNVFALHFNDTKDMNLLFGGGYRFSNEAFARIGFELKGLIFGAAYDFNLSSLNLTNTNISAGAVRGQGFELGLTYIARIYKDPVVKEILFNPRF
jgi:type IX secretion system PorP/SprF family membrane protein